MKITDFINDDFFSLPKTQGPNEDFKRFISRTFNIFLNKLDSVQNFEDISYRISRIKERQKHLVKQLNSAIEKYYDGKPAEALEELEKGVGSKIKTFEDVLNTRTFFPETDFYRIRIHKHNYPLNPENFFHIPFNLRGKIKTQRFSIPGFPSLYLGNSSYVCWEELNRPNLNDFQIVRLQNTETLKVIDLSPLKENETDEYQFYKFLMTWPIVFASSVKVRNSDDYFKPEYIIPQLLLQWVRKNDEIDGISYQTTHINFNESLSKGEFLNIVLPVKENKTKGLCNELESKFVMTESTSVQLNQCATDGSINGGGVYRYSNNQIQKIELIKGIPTNYDISIFGGLEQVLSEMECKEIIK